MAADTAKLISCKGTCTWKQTCTGNQHFQTSQSLSVDSSDGSQDRHWEIELTDITHETYMPTDNNQPEWEFLD